MAASALKYKRTRMDRLSVKGMLSDDGDVITYTDENGEERDMPVLELLAPFVGNPIDITLVLKDEMDLDFDEELEEEFDEDSDYEE